MSDGDFTTWVRSVRGAILAATSDTADAEPARAALAEHWAEIVTNCSLDPAARAALVDLTERLRPLAEEHAWAHWIAMILPVLQDEPFVALEPVTGTGLAGRMSGVVDNFQLHTLLMDVFPLAPGAARRVPEATAAVARGSGPQELEDPVHGVWSLCTYHALRDGRVKAPFDETRDRTWIWNEGKPADIPVLDGHRVILLGEAPYARSWKNCRMFPLLRATLNAAPLDGAAVGEWLSRIEAA